MVEPSKIREINEAYEEISRKSFLHFVRGLVISSASGPKHFDSVMANFQRECFTDLAPSLEALRDGTMPPKRRFWIERTKKTSKDCDIAACLMWLVAFSDRPILGQVSAANSEQASIIEDRALTLLHYNHWLRERVEVVQRTIRSRIMPKEVKVKIEATGTAGGAQGPAPDILVLNELVHVEKWDVMKAHMANANGVPQGIAIVATNAGIKGTQAEVWRRNAMEQRDRWSVHLWSQRAPWIAEEDVEEAKRMDPIGSDFKRLWEGEWVSGIGDAVDEASINRCFRLEGPTPKPESEWRYLAGLDLGISHDHSAIVVLGVHERKQRIKVVWLRAYMPSTPNDKGELEVDSALVRKDCLYVSRLYHVEFFGYDPAAGGSFMAQDLRKVGVPMREMTFASPANQTEMAQSFVTVVKDGRLECFEDPEGRLRRDFGKFRIIHKPPSKYRLEAISDEFGHADVGVALVISLPRAVEMLGGYGGLLSSDVLIFDEDEPLSKEEVQAMPDELRDIYEMEGESDEDEYDIRGSRQAHDADRVRDILRSLDL